MHLLSDETRASDSELTQMFNLSGSQLFPAPPAKLAALTNGGIRSSGGVAA